jgi:hypothetical protein
MNRIVLILFLIFWVSSTGCIERTSFSTKDKQEKVSKHVLKQKPSAIQHPLDINFENKVKLLGYDLDKESVDPGKAITITWYWQCLEPPGSGWRLFTHVLDAKGLSKINKDREGDIRKNFQPEHWRKGDFIRDIQKITVPGNWSSSTIEFRTGIWKGSERLKGKGENIDKRNRAIGPRISVGEEETKKVEIPKTLVAPVIDGKIEDDPAWQTALKLKGFVHPVKGTPVSEDTNVMLLWNDDALYVAMFAKDEHLESKYEKHDDELWHEDAFEIFLDPGADKKDYYELQVSPAGVVFDSYLPEYRQNHNEWSSKMELSVTRKGTIRDHSDKDEGWAAEIKIPFAPMKASPKIGDEWLANFFRVDFANGKAKYGAWSAPMRGDFHALDMFGRIVFSAGRAERDTATATETTGDLKPKEDKQKAEKKSP